MPTLSPLCLLNNGCMGCCGRDFISASKIKEAIRRNTCEFEQLNPISEAEFLLFRNRAHPADLLNGVCRNLIERNGRLLCPLHPALHNGKDLRQGHCDVDYLCEAAKRFPEWHKEKQQKFLEFIKSKRMDGITYSMCMGDDILLKEFESEEEKELSQ